ncbi:hypothetical protein SKAU_G00007880 [Synaphobranchus kaupii]|uniref:Uncharacterized protein n=1 Tax=Synaphobranchus kaupii TaxID=118154 RepID=A0A9Q1JCN6_SYNKA|nr:hypothetical protein SKAU_G00007880 [Synaphobranchus kaupii]
MLGEGQRVTERAGKSLQDPRVHTHAESTGTKSATAGARHASPRLPPPPRSSVDPPGEVRDTVDLSVIRSSEACLSSMYQTGEEAGGHFGDPRVTVPRRRPSRPSRKTEAD